MNTKYLAFMGQCVVAGSGKGDMLMLQEPVSFWGGVDPDSGKIIQVDHPQCGEQLGGKVMNMARAKGSSSSSSVLAELIRNGNAPTAIVMREIDLIVALGCIVASELYGIHVPVVTLNAQDWETYSNSASGAHVEVTADESGCVVNVYSA